MAIKQGWDFPSPSNASTRGYTRERGQGAKSPAVGRDETQKNAPDWHTRANPRDGRYARNDEFDAMTPNKNEDRQENRTGRKATQSGVQKFAKGGSVCAEPAKKAVHKHERHDHKGEPLTKLAKGGAIEARDKQAMGAPLKMAKGGNWIAGAVAGGKGALHRALGVPEGEKIPAKKMAKAGHSKSPKIRKEAALAKTLKGFHKG